MRAAQNIVATCLSVALALQGLAYGTTAYAVSIGGPQALEQNLTSLAGESDGDEDAVDAQTAAAQNSDAETNSQEELEGDGEKESAAEGETEASDKATDAAKTDAAETDGGAKTDDGAEAVDEAEAQAADDSESEIAVVDDAATPTEPYSTVEDLNTALGTHGFASGTGSNMVITFKDNDALKIISHANAALYQSATIKKDGSTGSGFSVASADGEVAAFKGFGSSDHPFEGKIVDSDGTSPIEIATDITFYNSLKVTDDNGTVKLKWVGETSYSKPMVATELSGEGTLDAAIDIANPTSESDITVASAAISAPLIGTSTASVTVNAEYSFSGTRRGMAISSASGNIGLLANTVSGGSFTIGGVAGLGSVSGNGSISTSSGNAGLFVGEVSDGATVSLGAYTLWQDVTVSSTRGCAGGLAGLVGSSDGATVTLTGAVDFTRLTAQGTTASGGLIGKATKLTLNQESGATFACPSTVGSTDSQNTGGFIGSVSFAGEKTFTGNNEVVTTSAVRLKGKTNAGAVFGYLDIANGNVTFAGTTDDTATTFKSALAENGGSVVYGGIVGRVEDKSATQIDTYYASTHTVTMSNVYVEGTCTKQAKTAGGLVGSLGSGNATGATLIVDDATVAWGGPWVSTSFGGVVGCVDRYSVLDCGSVTVSSTSEVSKGAGIVGETWVGTIHLRGTTDLSGLRLSASGYVGQIANTSAASPSLVFAEGSGSDTESSSGWIFKRPAAVAVDDLGGAPGGGSLLGNNEVVRLGSGELSSGLIKLDDTTHQPRFWLSENSTNFATEASDSKGYSWGRQLAYSSSSNTVSVASADEFACLALTIQTRGYFSGMSGIGYSSMSKFSSATINIADDINLTGTGITGLTQDVYTTNFTWAFTGTLNGNGHTVTLAVGEPYGMRGDTKIGSSDTSEGNGKIYYHNRLGLLGNDGGSTVNNLKLGGTIRAKSDAAMEVGAYAAEKCSTGGTTFTGLEVSTTLNLYQGGKKMFAGNVYGTVEDSGSITFASDCRVNSSLSSSNKPDGSTRIGGVIGLVDGDSTTTITVSNLAVSGKMEVDGAEKDDLGVGGFIAGIEKGSAKALNINGLSLSNLTLTYSGVKKTCGGFLGYSWANTNVTFRGSSSSAYALTASGTTLAVTETGSTAFSLGGLVYRASGVWDVGEYAIDLSDATLSGSNIKSGSNLGLLVCVGGDDGNLNGSLYLKNTAYWGTAYKVDDLTLTDMGNFSNYDEWVYDTRASGKGIADCGTNGVVSLHTQAEKLDMTGATGSRNSYVNRTSLGQTHQINGSSRYYYNLDRAVTSAAASTNSQIDTPYELLLWSVSRYADDNLTSEFAVGDADASGPTITGTLDMTGYSYYPVDVTGESVTVQNATITFCNSAIESEEDGNKLTSSATQHMNMHAGLLRNFYAGTDSSVAYAVSTVTLKGSVGMDVSSNTAGALLSGTMAGTQTNARVATLDINGLTLEGLTVHGVAASTSLAPLVACNLGTYTALNVNGITASNYSSGTTAATSLFGNLGGENADQVTASFINVAVPSLKMGDGADAIFTHASLLESYSYAQNGASSATYTFTKSDQDDSKVTFGSEIDSSGEYSGKQLWYYDESTYETPAGLVNDGTRTASATDPQYGVYLPYVATGKSGTAYHEIKVNQRLANLTVGCGTYGDPYAITTAGQLYAIANYINTGLAQDDWVVTITANQETICSRRADGGTTDNEVTYQYSASDTKWHKGTYSNSVWTAATDGATLDNDTMLRYIQSCYLSIEGDVTLDASAFTGLGTHDRPFRGVIVGNLVSGSSSYATLEINNASDTGIQGLITYSYGSVVRDLNVKYAGETNTIAYSTKNTDDGVPTAFFGGVIGCIMGGDNIIDGVTVSKDGSFDVSARGDKPHLVAIGGYVGAIAGGGVIFRNMTGSSWHASGANLYDNPYVGRVIDGFAFSEGCIIDNGDDNYKVNKLDTALTGCVTTSDIQGKYRGDTNSAVTVTVNNAQGLLVLSAIISSGAAAGPAHTSYTGQGAGVFYGSRAYQGWNQSDAYHKESGYSFGNDAYGKVRNATYEYVGSPAASSDDFVVSKADDTMAPGTQGWGGALDSGFISSGTVNSPYLVASYANKETGYVCVSKLTGIDLRFVGGESYDMTGYGTGFTGLSGRYFSNACYSGDKATDRERIIPRVACINGNSATLTLSSTVKEYKDDDYAVAGVGGLFSTVTFTSDSVSDSISANGASVKDIAFKNCNVSLTYLDSSNNAISDYAKSNTGVGILAGVTANANSQESYGVYKNVTITADSDQTTSVSGGENAGGLIGSAGYAQRSSSSSVDEIVSFSGLTAPIKLYDCSYSNLLVTGEANVGGFVGKIASGESGVWATASDVAFASSSTIAIDSSCTDSSNTAGGVFGLVGCSVNVNTGQEASATQLAVMSDVKITTECAASSGDGCTRGVGSIVGRAENTVSVNRLKVTASVDASSDDPVYLGSISATQNASTNTAAKNVGGIVGWSNKNVTVNDSTVEKLRIGAGEHSGGIVGTLDSGVTLSVDGSTVSALRLDGARMGGVVGNVNNSGATVSVLNSKIQNCAFSGTASYWKSHPGGNGNFSGGVVGYALGTYKISNVLLSENTFADTAKRQGLLVGCTAQDAGNFKGLYAAGIDVKLASGQTNSDVPGAICYFKESSDKAAINQKSYIAFADYTDDFGGTSGLYGAEGVSPYVTTSPKSRVTIGSGSLFGDGAAISTAATIQSQAGSNVGGRYTYTNIGGIDDSGVYQNSNDYSASTSASTFNDNNTNTKATSDFPVLLLSGNDTTTVTNYLNLVTNGGFSDAVRLNGSTKHVSASVQTVKLSDDGSFVADSAATPTISVVNDGTSNMFFRATSQWDNEKGQFSLLTVTFSEAGQDYKVQVPIIVKRMLEIDFTATYSYGTHFTPSDYTSLGANAHVLSNFGEPMTGYLTWTYNQAKGVKTEYGWDTHLASGGSMGVLGKSIDFSGSGTSGSLPAGTQLTLVDTANNDKAYHYTVSDSGASSVKLIDFVDSNGIAYAEQWLSELMGVSAKVDSSGAWVECGDDDANVGAKVVTDNETKCYRAYVEGDTGDRYTLTVAKGTDGKETSPSENFYLVVCVPNSGTITTAVNGYTSASFEDATINKNLTCTLRTGNTLDNHQNSASTYSIYSSYSQTLADTTGATGITELAKTDDGTGYTFPLTATDTITFDSAQQYNDSDKLYYQFGASLVSYVKSGDTASSSGASGFATGTTGTLNFYVKVGETYYVPSGSGDSTTWSAVTGEASAATKSWSANGNDLAVSLSDESGNLYDLSGLRKIAASSGSIEIIAKIADLKMTEEAAKQAIAASQDASSYTKIHYRSALSTRTDTLSTSNMVASAQGTPGYYRKDLGSSTIELTASKQTQLGINIDDLDLADGTIGAVGTYSLLKLVDGDSKIKQASSVKYTLTLQRRTGEDGTYSGVNIADYLTVKSSDLGTGDTAADNSSIVFTDDSLKTRDGNTNVFKFLFEVKVNTNVEDLSHSYANYRIVLTAQLLDANGKAIDTPENVNSAPSYPNSDYITYSLTKIRTDGISHS